MKKRNNELINKRIFDKIYNRILNESVPDQIETAEIRPPEIEEIIYDENNEELVDEIKFEIADIISDGIEVTEEDAKQAIRLMKIYSMSREEAISEVASSDWDDEFESQHFQNNGYNCILNESPSNQIETASIKTPDAFSMLSDEEKIKHILRLKNELRFVFLFDNAKNDSFAISPLLASDHKSVIFLIRFRNFILGSSTLEQKINGNCFHLIITPSGKIEKYFGAKSITKNKIKLEDLTLDFISYVKSIFEYGKSLLKGCIDWNSYYKKYSSDYKYSNNKNRDATTMHYFMDKITERFENGLNESVLFESVPDQIEKTDSENIIDKSDAHIQAIKFIHSLKGNYDYQDDDCVDYVPGIIDDRIGEINLLTGTKEMAEDGYEIYCFDGVAVVPSWDGQTFIVDFPKMSELTEDIKDELSDYYFHYDSKICDNDFAYVFGYFGHKVREKINILPETIIEMIDELKKD